MNLEYADSSVDRMYRELAELDIDSLTPEESSATWEIIKKLYKEGRRKKQKLFLIRMAAALSTTLIVGSVVFLVVSNRKQG